MRKAEIARRWARRSDSSVAEAADCLDRVVHSLLRSLRHGKDARVPGLGTFSPGKDGRVVFQREDAKPRE